MDASTDASTDASADQSIHANRAPRTFDARSMHAQRKVAT
jgi:hypothetical protein